MFAYCGNNPVNRSDSCGGLWEIIVAWAIAAVVSGVANAISTAINGGSVEDCLVAGLIGAGSAAVGFAVAAFTGFSPAGNLVGRAVATTLCDLGTTYYMNGEITSEDMLYIAADVAADVAFSTCVYSYTDPINDFVKQTFVNSVSDGGFDVAQTYFQNYLPSEQNSSTQGAISQNHTSTLSGNRGGLNHYYVAYAM